MAPTTQTTLRALMLLPLVMLLLIWPEPPKADDARPLPSYVIEAFGEPPAVPTGALSEESRAVLGSSNDPFDSRLGQVGTKKRPPLSRKDLVGGRRKIARQPGKGRASRARGS